MKNILKYLAPPVTAIAVFLYILIAPHTSAAPAGVYFAPASGTYTTGQSFTVDVYGTSSAIFGFPARTAVAVKYDSSKLSVQGTPVNAVAVGGSSLHHDAGTQTITLSHNEYGSLAAINNQKLFSVTFMTIAPGTTGLSFTSSILRGSDVTKNSGSYTVNVPTCPAGQVGTPPNCTTPPPPTCPAGQVGTPPNCTTPKAPTAPTTPIAPKPTPTPAPAPTPTPTAPIPNTSVPTPTEPVPTQPPEESDDSLTIQDIRVDAEYTTASITWQTNHPTKETETVFAYGTDPSKLDNTASVTADTTTNESNASLSQLQLGVQYFYTITVPAPNGEPVTQKGSFTTKSYPVLLKFSHNKQPIVTGKLQLKGFNESYTSNEKGEIMLSLKPGEYIATLTKDSMTDQQAFTVKKLSIQPGKAPDTQVISIDIAGSSEAAPDNARPLGIIIGAALLLLLVGGAVGFIIWRKHHQSQDISGYQSMIDDFDPPATPEAPLAYQPQMPSFYPDQQTTYTTDAPGAINYTNPQEQYTSSQQPLYNTPDTEAAVDMWDTPTMPAQQTLQPMESQYPYSLPAPMANPAEIATIPTGSTENPYATPEVTTSYPTIEQQPVDFTTTSYQEPPATIASSTATEQSSVTEDYEYSDDNTMTIHHAS